MTNNPTLHVDCSRRQFLNAVGAGSAACALTASMPLAASLAEEKSSKWRMRLSTSSIHFLHQPVEDACARIARLGFEAVDIWSAHAGCPHLDDVATRLGAEGLSQVLKDTGLKLFSFSTYRGGYARYAELLGKAGGGVAVQGSTRACSPAELVAKMGEFLESLKPLVALAEQYDSYLAVENHANALLDSLDSFKAFVDLNRSRRLGIALAPYHVQGRGQSVVEAIEICGEQLFFFYAWQRAAGTQQLPGIGPVDFKPWLEALAKINYRGCVNPFMHGDVEPEEMEAALAKSRQYLIRCQNELQ